MSLFSELRAIVLLRKMVRGISSIESSMATLARIETERWEKENLPRIKLSLGKPSVMDIEAVNQAWKDRHPYEEE